MKTDILLESGTNEVEFLEAFVGGTSFGINVSKVQQIIAYSEVKVTGSPESQHIACLEGTFLFRGAPVLLVDLRKALSVESKDGTRPMVVVTRFNRRTVGFTVDSVTKIHRVKWNEFEPTTTGAGLDSGFTLGTVILNKNIVQILDLEKLMFVNFPQKEDGEFKSNPEHKTERSQVKIVYAEDSGMIRKMTMRNLIGSGYTQITEFDNGEAALKYVLECYEKAGAANESIHKYIDVILTDIEMPKMDGMTFCKNVKSMNTTKDSLLAVVIYSSLVNEEITAKCKSVGADGQIAKPHGPEIVTLIDSLVGITKAP